MADIIPLFPNRSDEEPHPRVHINAAVAELRRVVPGWLEETEATVASLAPYGDSDLLHRTQEGRQAELELRCEVSTMQRVRLLPSSGC